MGARRIRRELRRVDQKASRRANGPRKAKERVRRHARLLEALKAGSLPYTPTVMSWLSAAIDKPSTKITQDDVAALLKV